DRYELKLGKKTGSQTAPLVKEWADMILFCNYETYAVATDKDGKKFKAQGGQRVMYTTHHPCWDAKNRAGLPPKLSLDYSEIAHVIEGTSPAASAPAPTVTAPPKTENAPSVQPTQIQGQSSAPVSEKQESPKPENIDLSDFEDIIGEGEPDIPPNIPKPLQDLMKTNSVSEKEIRFAVSKKGYFPERMSISDYPPDFINGVLIGAWPQVFAMIKDNRDLPF
ncbi:MAG: AAA family ATPase, partial [Oscillospiraceae bacterium]